MGESALFILLGTAVSIGFIHTLMGVDHFLPFIAIGKAREWTLKKTLALTALCGVGHVMGSVILGFLGIGLGVALEKLNVIESVRGELTSWFIIAFGLTYAAWAWIRVQKQKSHTHVHTHANGTTHSHEHTHQRAHAHPHPHTHPNTHPKTGGPSASNITVWSLFIIFVFGPCEALIPILMAPAAEHHWLWVAMVTAAFGVTTVGTMMAAVAVGYVGLSWKKMAPLSRYANVAAGVAIASSGIAIKALGI